MTDALQSMVQLENVGKRYVKYDDAPMLATALLHLPGRSRRSRLWAVRNVDLDVKQGEAVGIIGRNGSGKSTLLQMISGITSPTEGHIRVRGRIAPLISVGVGFHPELSGRDNLYVNGAILGLSRAEVDRRFDDVVQFAEMESFIDTPVKFYSSGMSVRLGFSMAIQSTPDVLIVDEVLAVGDMAFQLRCYERMQEIRKAGTTIVIVSHNMNGIRTFCDRVVVLHQGEMQFDGDPGDGVAKLHTLLQTSREVGDLVGGEDKTPFEAGVMELDKLELIGPDGVHTANVNTGDTLTVRFHVTALQDVDQPFCMMTVHGQNGLPVYGESNRPRPFGALKAGRSAIFDIAWDAKLASGGYVLRTMVGRVLSRTEGRRCAMPQPMAFYVTGRPGVIGIADFDASFHMEAATNGKGRTRGRSTGSTTERAAGPRSTDSG